MEKTDEQREADTVRHIVQIRVVMSRHGLAFGEAAAVLQLSALHELLDTVAQRPAANGLARGASLS
jgi:hypothetical protein